MTCMIVHEVLNLTSQYLHFVQDTLYLLQFNYCHLRMSTYSYFMLTGVGDILFVTQEEGLVQKLTDQQAILMINLPYPWLRWDYPSSEGFKPRWSTIKFSNLGGCCLTSAILESLKNSNKNLIPGSIRQCCFSFLTTSNKQISFCPQMFMFS